MKNLKEIWAQKVQNKDITSADMMVYCALRAMNSKSDNKKDVAKYLAAKAFSPSKKHDTPYRGAIIALNSAIALHSWRKTIFGIKHEDFFDSPEELAQFDEILRSIAPCDFDRVYSYIFVRQDISPEYQLVQAAHAAMVLGYNLGEEHNPRETYFAVCGVENSKELLSTAIHLESNNFLYESFIEPDIGNQITAIATYPIHWNDRQALRKYKKLTFTKENTLLNS